MKTNKWITLNPQVGRNKKLDWLLFLNPNLTVSEYEELKGKSINLKKSSRL